MDRIHKICSTKGKATGRIYMVQEETYKETKKPRVLKMYGQICGNLCLLHQRRKEKWAIEKPKLENARQLRGIFFIEPEDEEFKHTMKNARGKLEIPMPAAMPCKIPIKSSGKTQDKICLCCWCRRKHETKVEGAVHKYHQDHITEKGKNSLTHYSLVLKFIPMPQAVKILDAKPAVVKEWDNWRKSLHGRWRKSETRKRWSMKQGIREETFISRHWWIFVILRIRSWNLDFKNTMVESYSEVTL